MPHKKSKVRVIQKSISNTENPNCPQQFNIKAEVDTKKKVKSKDVFDGYSKDCGCKKCSSTKVRK